MSETQLVSAILDALALEPGVVAWRNNTGRKGRVTFGLGTGSADIIACVSGRFVALEAKSDHGVLSLEQRRWGNGVYVHGGVYALVRSVADARAAIASARDQTTAMPKTCQVNSTARR